MDDLMGYCSAAAAAAGGLIHQLYLIQIHCIAPPPLCSRISEYTERIKQDIWMLYSYCCAAVVVGGAGSFLIGVDLYAGRGKRVEA